MIATNLSASTMATGAGRDALDAGRRELSLAMLMF